MSQLKGEISSALSSDDQVLVLPSEEGGVEKTVEDIIINYMKEIGIDNHLGLPKSEYAIQQARSLVASHVTLRSEFKKSRREQTAELEVAVDNMRKLILDRTWIKIEDLRKMTLQEIIARIGEE